MTRKRSSAKPATPRKAAASAPATTEARQIANPDAPITGVASGSLGTAANLDDTQVMRTADLQRAAAEVAVPAWLTDDAPPLPEEPEAWAAEPVPARKHVQPPERVQPREPVKARRRAASGTDRDRRRTALTGAVAGAFLVLVIGAGMLGAMGGFGTNPAAAEPPLAEATQAPVATPTAAASKEGKGCHGKGKGNDCKD